MNNEVLLPGLVAASLLMRFIHACEEKTDHCHQHRVLLEAEKNQEKVSDGIHCFNVAIRILRGLHLIASFV